MDGAPVRSRTSQSPSPSHSTASASASSSVHHKRKFPPPDVISAKEYDEEEEETEMDEEEEEEIEEEEEEEEPEEEEIDDDQDEENNNNNNNNSSIRTFTAARFDAAAPQSNLRSVVKPPKNEPVSSTTAASAASAAGIKVEGAVGAVKEEGGGGVVPAGGAAAAVGGLSIIPGIMVKDDPAKGIFTDNIQASGAYSAREEGLKREEDAGRLKFMCCANDGVDQHMIWLIGLKNIFARQLPNMPKEYIVRLVMDRTHKSMMVIRHNHVVGGITYRPYNSQRFGEIAFCAITSDEQVKGYGTRLMNHLKQHARDIDGLTHFLTYADNNAVGYFIKQGFTKEITLERDRWHGYIKDYDGGILMECKIDPKLPYTDLSTMIRKQRQAIDEKIRELSYCHIVYAGIDFQKKEAGIPRKPIKVEDIPGLREAGWTPDQWGHSRYKPASSVDGAAYRQQLNAFMRGLLKMMNDHPDAWPFREPVDARDVPDYYDIIKDPMDLRTMSKRLESELYYVTFEMFVADVKRMFANARTYNSPETIYYKCATRLENFFSNKVQAHLQTSSKNP